MKLGLALVAALLAVMFVAHGEKPSESPRIDGESLRAYRVFQNPSSVDNLFVFVTSQLDSVESAESAYEQAWVNAQALETLDFTDIAEISGNAVGDQSRWFTAVSPDDVEVTGVIFRDDNLVQYWTLTGTPDAQSVLSQLATDYADQGTPAALDESAILRLLPDLQQLPLDGFEMLEEQILTADAMGEATPSPQA